MKYVVNGISGVVDHFNFDIHALDNNIKDILLARSVEPGDVIHIYGSVTSIAEGTHNIVVRTSDGDSYYISRRDGASLNNIQIVNDLDGSTYGSISQHSGPQKQIVAGVHDQVDHFTFDETLLNNGYKDRFLARNVEAGDVIHINGDVASFTQNVYNVVVRLNDGDSYYISRRDGASLENLKIINDQNGSIYGEYPGSDNTPPEQDLESSEGAPADEDQAPPLNVSQSGDQDGEDQDDVYVAIFGNGQSLMVGTTTSAMSGPTQGGYMIDWDNINHDANGPGSAALGASLGLVQYQNTGREVEGAGVIDGLRSIAADTKVVFGTTAVGGKKLEELASGTYHQNALKQIATMVAEIKSAGTLSSKAFIHWEQGQADTATNIQTYKDNLLNLFAEYDAAFDAAAGFDVEVNLVITQVRSYSQGLPSQAQFELAQEHDDIWLVNTEPQYQYTNPASATDFTHISAQGQYDKGYDTGKKIAQWYQSGDEGKTATVESVTFEGTTLTVTYTGIQGSLRIGDFYTDPGAKLPGMESFGASIFTPERTATNTPDILSSQIIAPNMIEHTLSAPMTRSDGLYATSREHYDNSHGSWLEDDTGMVPFQYFAFDFG